MNTRPAEAIVEEMKNKPLSPVQILSVYDMYQNIMAELKAIREMVEIKTGQELYKGIKAGVKTQ